MSIKDNLLLVRENIAEAARRSGRSIEDILLLAVSKKQPMEKIVQAVECGQHVFGENYVQELLSKQSELAQFGLEQFEFRQSEAIETIVQWHLIGSLQRKKVKQVVGHVDLIHSVDRKELIESLQAAAAVNNTQQRILLQVNVAREESKSGILEEDFLQVAESAVGQANLQVVGVMSLPPLANDENDIRRGFEKTRWYLEKLQQLAPQASVLSMGTTHDYPLAVEEGATIVRVGTAIFGSRD